MLKEELRKNFILLDWFSPDSPPLEVDFGCHRGTFLADMARLNPNCNFLGIERQAERVQKCLNKFKRLGLTNVTSVQGEGAESLRHWLPDASVDVLHVSFPDPWPKRRHAARRLVNPQFICETKRVLAPTGILRFMTDDAAYFAEIKKITSMEWEEIPWNDGRETVHTSFERKFISLEQKIFRCALRFKKCAISRQS